MRVVLYNFVQPDDSPMKEGGGVAIYQRNLLRALHARGDSVILLSSGDKYSATRPYSRLVFRKHDEYVGVERAYILNSPMFAPAHSAFHSIAAYEDGGLDRLSEELKKRYGTIDVFHFQNIEGLTAGFFRGIRKTFPQARILMSAHNYNLVCPQVNLWFREHKSCEDYRDGRACVNCIFREDRSAIEFRIRRIGQVLDRLGIGWHGSGSRAVQFGMRALFYLERLYYRNEPLRFKPPDPAKGLILMDDRKATPYYRFRRQNIDLCTNVFDKVLAVSQRSKDVLVKHGLPESKVAVSYIGTAHSQTFRQAIKKRTLGEGLHIGFLGYMRADKGFYFLLESLFSIPDTLAKNISVTIAAPVHDWGAIHRLKGIAYRFRKVVVHNGYRHSTLDQVLAGVNLGIVPVLWEDNLPQVAIEIVSRGIPILTSDRGGAQEIASNARFTFQSGSTRDFCAKLEEIATGRLPLAEFWAQPSRIFSMAEHLEDLLQYYGVGQPQKASATRTLGPELQAALGGGALGDVG